MMRLTIFSLSILFVLVYKSKSTNFLGAFNVPIRNYGEELNGEFVAVLERSTCTLSRPADPKSKISHLIGFNEQFTIDSKNERKKEFSIFFNDLESNNDYKLKLIAICTQGNNVKQYDKTIKIRKLPFGIVQGKFTLGQVKYAIVTEPTSSVSFDLKRLNGAASCRLIAKEEKISLSYDNTFEFEDVYNHQEFINVGNLKISSDLTVMFKLTCKDKSENSVKRYYFPILFLKPKEPSSNRIKIDFEYNPEMNAEEDKIVSLKFRSDELFYKECQTTVSPAITIFGNQSTNYNQETIFLLRNDNILKENRSIEMIFDCIKYGSNDKIKTSIYFEFIYEYPSGTTDLIKSNHFLGAFYLPSTIFTTNLDIRFASIEGEALCRLSIDDAKSYIKENTDFGERVTSKGSKYHDLLSWEVQLKETGENRDFSLKLTADCITKNETKIYNKMVNVHDFKDDYLEKSLILKLDYPMIKDQREIFTIFVEIIQGKAECVVKTEREDILITASVYNLKKSHKGSFSIDATKTKLLSDITIEFYLLCTDLHDNTRKGYLLPIKFIADTPNRLNGKLKDVDVSYYPHINLKEGNLIEIKPMRVPIFSKCKVQVSSGFKIYGDATRLFDKRIFFLLKTEVALEDNSTCEFSAICIEESTLLEYTGIINLSFGNKVLPIKAVTMTGTDSPANQTRYSYSTSTIDTNSLNCCSKYILSNYLIILQFTYYILFLNANSPIA